MKHLYLTRHGQTEWNLVRRWQGSEDSPLTEMGIYHAKKLGKRLRDTQIDKVYSSDLKRAIDTAKYIIGERDIEHIPLRGLREMHMGDWEGQLITEIDPELVRQFTNLDEDFPYPGETYDEMRLRVTEAFKIIDNDEAKSILMVSHGITQGHLFNILEKTDRAKRKIMAGTALSYYIKKEDRYIPQFTGDLSHIEDQK